LVVGFFFQRSCHPAYLVALRLYRVWVIAAVALQSPQMVLAAQGRVAASTIPGIEDIKPVWRERSPSDQPGYRKPSKVSGGDAGETPAGSRHTHCKIVRVRQSS
jgi:hypothetical protein